MRTVVVAVAAALVAASAGAGTASANVYKVDVRGSQKVTWSFSGELVTGGCGELPVTRQMDGSGSSEFTFTTRKPGTGVAVRNRRTGLHLSFSAVRAKVTGTLVGSWTASETRGGCPEDIAPLPATSESTAACGAQTWTMKLDGRNAGNAFHVTGQEDFLTPGSPSSSRADECPVANGDDRGLERAGGPTACELQGGPGHLVSWELAPLGRGIANVKIPTAGKGVGKKTFTLSRKVTKHCEIVAQNGANGTRPAILIDVTTQLTATFRRVGR